MCKIAAGVKHLGYAVDRWDDLAALELRIARHAVSKWVSSACVACSLGVVCCSTEANYMPPAQASILDRLRDLL